VQAVDGLPQSCRKAGLDGYAASGERHQAMQVLDYHAIHPCMAPIRRDACKIALLQSCVSKGKMTRAIPALALWAVGDRPNGSCLFVALSPCALKNCIPAVFQSIPRYGGALPPDTPAQIPCRGRYGSGRAPPASDVRPNRPRNRRYGRNPPHPAAPPAPR
jgi:hypothetical protein